MSKDKNFGVQCRSRPEQSGHETPNQLARSPTATIIPDSTATVSRFGFEIIAKMQSIGAPRFWLAHHSNESLSMRASQRDCMCIDPQAAQGAFTSD